MNPDAGVTGTIVAYFSALAVPALVIAAMMAVPAALVGLVAAPALTRIVTFLNRDHSERWAMVIGSATCLAITGILLILFQRMLGFTLADVAANPETFLFWFALPSLIFMAAGGLAGRQFNRTTNEGLRLQ